MAESNIIKEAIATAKAVRQTALANAKVALEEQFSQQYESILSKKLQEDTVDDLPEAPAGNAPEMGNAPVAPEAGATDLDQLIKELETELAQGDQPPTDPTAAPAPAPSPMDVPPAPQACVPAPAPTAAPVPPAPPMDTQVPPAPMDTQVPPAPQEDPNAVPTDEELDINELLESLKEDEDEEKNEKDEEDGEKIDEVKKLASSAIAKPENKKPSAVASSSSQLENGSIENEGIPSVDSAKTIKTASRPNSDGDIEGTSKLTKENVDLKNKLNEAYDTINYVKEQLNEVNLLNAKLLYTNKLFKEFNMNNEQKMRVVEMFDLSKNVREVKMTYANIAESINFSGNNLKRPAKTETTQVKAITEGLASKPVGSTKPTKEIITESSAMVDKFQKLAGIRNNK